MFLEYILNVALMCLKDETNGFLASLTVQVNPNPFLVRLDELDEFYELLSRRFEDKYII